MLFYFGKVYLKHIMRQLNLNYLLLQYLPGSLILLDFNCERGSVTRFLTFLIVNWAQLGPSSFVKVYSYMFPSREEIWNQKCLKVLIQPDGFVTDSMESSFAKSLTQ